MKKKISQQLWVKRKEADKFFFAAKSEGYRARSVYKLLEINKKFNILRENMNVVDLGAAPGSWSQMIANYLFKNKNSKSKVYAIDIQDIEPIERVIILKKNINDLLEESNFFKKNSLDLVLSDMAPKSTGHRFTDQTRSIDLVEKAIFFAQNYLSFKGNFVCKILGVNDNNSLIKQVKKNYERVKLFKPKASMKGSKEIYLICLSFNNLQ